MSVYRVFAIASPIGTPNDAFRAELEGGLHAYGYTAEWVKLSRLLADQAQARGVAVPDSPEDLRVSGLMDEGDRLCAEFKSSAAVALHGVNEIRQKRIEHHTREGAIAVSNSMRSKRSSAGSPAPGQFGGHIAPASLPRLTKA